MYMSINQNMSPFEITCLDPLQLRERAQVCPWRVGFELGPSHKKSVRPWSWCAGHTIINIYISFSDWILIRDQWWKGLPTCL